MSKRRRLLLSYCLVVAIALAGFLVLVAGCSKGEVDSGGEADSVVAFPDSNLESLVREAIGKASGDIRKSDLSALTDLGGSELGISDLTGLEYCTSLRQLYLENNGISDLSPLSGLTSLTVLALPENQISDLSPISGLIGLRELYLGGNQIGDLSSLSGLSSLTIVGLYSNQISNLAPLSGLSGLTEVYFEGNQISDLTPLSGLSGIRVLNFEGNQISDLTPLAGLTSLAYLSCLDNEISDIGPLVSNPGMGSGDVVDLRGNPLNSDSVNTWIPALKGRGVDVCWGTLDSNC